jgi:hypothetical protein
LKTSHLLLLQLTVLAVLLLLPAAKLHSSSSSRSLKSLTGLSRNLKMFKRG